MDDSQAWAVTWTAEEPMQRSSHALAHEGRVWLVDPIADEPALHAAEALGEVVAVVQLHRAVLRAGRPAARGASLPAREAARASARLRAEHLLVDHGAALHERAAPALTEALERSRRDIPRVPLAMVRAYAG